VKTHDRPPRSTRTAGDGSGDDGSVGGGDACAPVSDDASSVSGGDLAAERRQRLPKLEEPKETTSPVVTSSPDRKRNGGGGGVGTLPVYSNIDDWYVCRQAAAPSGFGGLEPIVVDRWR